LRRYCLVLVFSFLIVPVRAQNLNTASGYIPGQPYVTDGIDTIDLASGSISLNIPLRSFKQQDPVSIDYSIQYSSKHLAMGTNEPCSYCYMTWVWTDAYVFQQGTSPYSLSDSLPFTGARVALNQDYRITGSGVYTEGHEFIVTPDGGRHELVVLPDEITTRMADPEGWKLVTLNNTNTVPSYMKQGMIVDRSGVAHTIWPDNQITSSTGPVPLYENRGFTPSMIQFDPTDFRPTSILDSKGLTLPWSDPNTGHVGTAVTGTSPCANVPNFSTVYRLDMPGPGGPTVPYYLCYGTIQINTNFTSYPAGVVLQDTQDLQFLEAIVLPNSAQWSFEYSDRDPGDDPSINYGTLTKVTFPTGGTISYTYATVIPCPAAEADGTMQSRFITSKTENHMADGTPGGQLGPATWTYAYTPGTMSSGWAGNPDDPYVVNNYSDAAMLVTNPDKSTEYHSFRTDETTCGGYEDSNVVRDSSNNVLSATSSGYTITGNFGQDELGPISSAPTYAPVDVTTRLSDGSSFSHYMIYDTQRLSNSTYAFDPYVAGTYSYGNIVEECVMDYGVSLVQTPNTTDYCLQAPTLSHTITNYEYQTNANVLNDNMVDLVHQKIITDANNNPVAQTKNIYDAVYVGFYGNLSETDTWLNTNSANPWIPKIFQYDAYGVMTSSTDALNHATTYGMDSTETYQQTVTAPSTNGITHVSTKIYDPNTDQVARSYDENGSDTAGKRTLYGYDPMLRLNSIVLPTTSAGAGGATITYADAPNASMVSASMIQSSAANVSASQSYDGFGRPWRSTIVDQAGNILTDTTYDLMGHVIAVSNPYRALTDSTYGMTCTSFDQLGRVISVRKVAGTSCASTAPSLTSSTTQYSGRITDLFDGDGHHSRQQHNALGQLIKVWEPDSSNTPSLETDYGYDALGDLTQVNQIGTSSDTPRLRQFTYDSLSRLIAAYNPETGTGSGTCPGTSQPWSICYGYDLGDNLTSKTDARGVVEIPSYDALNRVTSKTYTLANGSPDPSHTPSTCYTYDVSGSGANFKGRLVAEWTQLESTCGNSPPADALTSRTILSYDALGHVTQDVRCIGGGTTSCFNSGVLSYDLAGNLTQYSNQAATITNVFDSVNRLLQVSSQTNSANPPLPMYSVTSFGPAGPQTIDIGSTMTKARTYDPLLRPSAEATYQKQ